MGFFNKKIITIRFVKETTLTIDGQQTIYFTELNRKYVDSSVCFAKDKAEEFFNKFVELKGKSKSTEILIEKEF